MFCFRYKGKGRLDAVMAEICWRAQHLFSDVEFRCTTGAIDEEEIKQQEAQMFVKYRDSDDEDDDYDDYDEFF